MKLLTPFLMLFFSLCFTAVPAQGASPTVSFDVMGYLNKSPEFVHNDLRIDVGGDMYNLRNIHAENIHRFPVSGTCSEPNREVLLTATKGGKSTSEKLICNVQGKWETFMDLTPIIPFLPLEEVPFAYHDQARYPIPIQGLTHIEKKLSPEKKLLFTVTHTNTQQERATATSLFKPHFFFFCPENYIPVPHRFHEGVTSSRHRSFCISKYEMTAPSSYPQGAIPKANNGLPLLLTRDEALARCQSWGETFDLVSNEEWQIVARNIEGVASNWSGGKITSGSIYKGVNYHSPSEVAPPFAVPDNDSQGCWGPHHGNQCAGGTSNPHPQSKVIERRTLTLSNGFMIWDFAGNAPEWVKDLRVWEDYGPYPTEDIKVGDKSSHSAYKALTPVSLLEGASLIPGVRLEDWGQTIHIKMFPLKVSNPRFLFGPEGDYSQLAGNQGFGVISIHEGLKYAPLARGGGAGSKQNSGIFTADTYIGSLSPQRGGFRCVYRPGAPFGGEEARRY